MSEEPRMAEHIHIGATSIEVDGEVFPWVVAKDGVRIESLDKDVSAVSLTLYTRRLTMDVGKES